MLGLLVVAILIAVYVYNYYEGVKRYPRGPRPLPLVGNLLQFTPSRLHAFLEESSKEFGDVFTVWTPRPTIILTSYASIKEALVTRGDDFAGRMRSFPDDMWMTTENGGVIFSDGERWREQRRVAIQILRDFGMSKNLMEQQVQASLHEFMRHLDSIEDKSAIDLRWPLQVLLSNFCESTSATDPKILVANVINNVLFGYHYPYDNSKRLTDYADRLTFQAAREPIQEPSDLAGRAAALHTEAAGDRLACGRQAPGVPCEGLPNHVREDVAACQASFNEHEDPHCFVHAYMMMGRGRNGENLTNDQLINVCNDFYMAGMETTSTTLRWAMALVAANQDAQDRIREEVHSVLGRTREVTMADRARLPYTMAAITEVQRIANILPLNVMHRTLVDTEVGGHFIPASTLCLPQIHAVMRDPEVFQKPSEFRPDRFLMEDGKSMNKVALEKSIPFSLGKRQCAGEGLARMELFLGLVTILQKYRILPPKDGFVDLTPTDAIISTPKTNLLQMELMRLFLLLLHFSLVLVTWQREPHPNEVHTKLKDGFPVVIIDLYSQPTAEIKLRFKLHNDLINTYLQSVVLVNNSQINDSKYLPFLNGFHVLNRTMPGVDTITSLHLSSVFPDKPNFNKTEVYMTLRLPSKAKDGSISPNPEEVLANLDAANIEKDMTKRTEFKDLVTFSIGKKIKLSALMISNPANGAHKDTKNTAKHHATLIFMNTDGTWAFGMCNKYDETTNKLHLFSDNAIAAGKDQAWPSDVKYWTKKADCSGSSSSTDILHVKLERPDKLTIKMRILYKESPAGITCLISIPEAEAAHLEGPLKIVGVQGATLLYIKA
uniref:Cytochrome P450 n=1 Tax=Pristionchus pacificus TaxID=54126 RepID=A0A2A6CTF8_PRIPA|eukprot:PDM81512.1 cytochrome P450 [Pristionchus pacificus]